MTKPTIICLTPVKNEAWILDRFLQCASLWADYIIIADQQSNDGSREIALNYPKVILVDNPSLTFNEPERQKLLIDAARKIPEPRLLVALDADEILTSNFVNSSEWNTILKAKTGTVVQCQRVELRPDMASCWNANADFFCAFMDDGSEHNGREIHSPRIPLPAYAPKIILHDIKVLHYQYTDWKRMKSKQRYYQCWERLKEPRCRSINLYRLYHIMDAISQQEIYSLPREWLSFYEQKGIDMTSVLSGFLFWWDQEIVAWLDKYGANTFKRENIWDIDWSLLAKENTDCTVSKYADPRNKFDKYIHRWLAKTQPIRYNRYVRLIESLLSLIGW